jgi:hypothetical protein
MAQLTLQYADKIDRDKRISKVFRSPSQELQYHNPLVWPMPSLVHVLRGVQYADRNIATRRKSKTDN